MATKKTYNEVAQHIDAMNAQVESLRGLGVAFECPNRTIADAMGTVEGLLGKVGLVDELELEQCSESEKERHLKSDRLLRLLYVEHDPYADFIVKLRRAIDAAKDAHARGEAVATLS